MDMNKIVQAENWDGTKIQVRLIDTTEWAKWNTYNRRNKIHPIQKVFTESDFLPKEIHLNDIKTEDER